VPLKIATSRLIHTQTAFFILLAASSRVQMASEFTPLQNIFEINKFHALNLLESHILGDKVFTPCLQRGSEMQCVRFCWKLSRNKLRSYIEGSGFLNITRITTKCVIPA
jgi:hypothetical protein